MHIVFTCDDNYIQHSSVAICSLLENNKNVRDLNIHYISSNLSEENRHKIETLINKYSRKITFYNFNITKYDFPLLFHFTESIYHRIFLSEILSGNIEKIIYLDSDIVACEELNKLYNTDMKDCLVAGVCDSVDNDNNKKRINLSLEDPYINTGVLIINLKQWRKENVQEKTLEIIKNNPDMLRYPDQDAINLSCCGRKMVLPIRYNVISYFFLYSYRRIVKYYPQYINYNKDEIYDAKNNPVIIHFTGPLYARPWIKGIKHPKRKMYYDYLELTPWKGYKPIEQKNIKPRISVYILYKYLPTRLVIYIKKIYLKYKNI